MSESTACSACGFSLWNPLAELTASTVGLYDDARFPGRVIVSLHEHYDHLDALPVDSLNAFMADVCATSAAVRQLNGVERTNIAVLGNKVAHVHAHVIPRRADEPNYGVSPWENAPEHTRLTKAIRESISDRIRRELLSP